MYTKQPKKLLIMNILDILRRFTDADHRLSQKDIIDILKRDYEMDADRKAIRRNILDLIDFGYEIEYTSTVRRMTNPKTGETEESEILSDFYLNRDFTDAELRLLIDSLLFSKHIPYSQCKELVKKLEGLSSEYFHAHVRHIHTMPETLPQNPQLFLTIETLDEDTLETINRFFENNLNVSETSRKLYVHRNTLVYRLEKIKKITGLDLREFDHAIVFKVAMMVKQYLDSLNASKY